MASMRTLAVEIEFSHASWDVDRIYSRLNTSISSKEGGCGLKNTSNNGRRGLDVGKREPLNYRFCAPIKRKCRIAGVLNTYKKCILNNACMMI